MSPKKWLLAFLLLIPSAWACAQPFPAHLITLVIPYAPGGPTDIIARVVAESMGKNLGQSVVVENLGGAGGTLGAAHVAKSAPDGYTLLLDHLGLATAQTLYPHLPYDTRTAFSSIGLITESPMAIIVRPGIAVKDLAGLISLAKQHPGTLTFGHSGLGGADQLCGLLLGSATGAQFLAVPYRGAAPVMTDMLGGRVDVTCGQLASTAAYIKSGKVRGLAITSPKRSSVLPEVPTTREAGVPKMDITVWNGVFAPRGTPAPVVARLARALQAAMLDPVLIARFHDLGTDPASAAQATPAALAKRLSDEIDRWAPIITAAGQYAD